LGVIIIIIIILLLLLPATVRAHRPISRLLYSVS